MDSENPKAQSKSDVPSTSSKDPPSGGQKPTCPFDNLVVLNFKTTFDEYSHDHPHEVIQMAATMLYGPGPDWTAKPETDFSEIVRPTRRPKLADHITQLTGISQKDVDKAEEFPKVFEKFEKWLETTGVAKSNFAIATVSRSTIWKLAQYQFILCNMVLPVYLKRSISITEIFHATTYRMVEAAKQKKEQEGRLEEKKPAAEEQGEVWNPYVKNPFPDNHDRQDPDAPGQEPIVVLPIDPNDPGLNPFRRGLAEAEQRDQQRLAEARRRAQEWLDNQPDIQESDESYEFDQSNGALAIPNVMDAVEQPRARKRASDESNDSEELVGLDDAPPKKIKHAEHPFIDRLCRLFNIHRTGRAYNAADDATTLRDLIEEMLKDGKTIFYLNCMMVCYDEKREHKWQYKLRPDWKQDFETVRDIFVKVLPLFGRRIDINDHVDYSKCITCEKPLEECGVDWIHRQFPSEFFDPSKKICGEILFATEAGLDINKLITSTSDNVKKEIDQNGVNLDGGEEDSDDGKKNL